jgi:hypothetical protein
VACDARAATPSLVALDLEAVEPERRAAVALDAIEAARRRHEREHPRPKALTDHEALCAVQYEHRLLCTALANVFAGTTLTEADQARVRVAIASTAVILDEVAPVRLFR